MISVGGYRPSSYVADTIKCNCLFYTLTGVKIKLIYTVDSYP